MSWRRLPTFLPNFPLKLMPLSEAQQTFYEKTGFLKDLAFKTVPQVTKVRPGWSCSQTHHPLALTCRPPSALLVSLDSSMPLSSTG